MLKVHPMKGKVALQREAEEGVSKGGIILPDSAKKKPRRGKVLSIGDNKAEDIGFKTGDTVLFKGGVFGNEEEVDKILIVPVEDVLARVVS